MRMIFRNINWVAIAKVNLRGQGGWEILKAGKPDGRII